MFDLRSEDGNSWNELLLKQLCNEESVEAILRTPWPSVPEEYRIF